ncbi:MAG: sensor histidine kinase [Polyangiaceae bacterium]|nr:sensor histidine kinase [Polyangiaceae bacterium]
MSKGRLTRQELGWLLTQEAQGAAERLRRGVSALTEPPPRGTGNVDATGVDATLSALDEAMRMLSSLHAQPASVRGRRGRIDLASLLWEVAPDAIVSMEPGSGTEVFADEGELRRILHVMLGHGSGTGSNASIRRDGDDVVLAVVLGPDSSASDDAERAWLSRMAVRYGGCYELEGSTAVLALPAGDVEARDDVERLRRELDEARKQGETYARELAAAWAVSEGGTSSSSYPPPGGSSALEHVATITRLSGGIAATLRAMLSPVSRDLADCRAALAGRKTSPDLDAVARLGLEERLDALGKKLLFAQDFVAELGAAGACDPHAPRRIVDLTELVEGEVRAFEARAARVGVELCMITAESRAVPERARAAARVAPGAAAILVRQLLSHAVSASRRGSKVLIELHPSERELGARLVVDDAGTPLPASARRALLALEVEPGTFGRPPGVALFLAAEIAASQSALLDVGDSPANGVRVTVTFAGA